MRHDVRGAIRRHLPGVAAHTVEALGEGLDNAAYLVDGEWVVRFPNDPEALSVEREARLLGVVREVLRGIVDVPEPAFAAQGAMGYRVLPGVPLLKMADRAPQVAMGTLRAVLDALHAEPVERFAVGVDAEPPAVWLDEVRAMAAEVDLPEAAWFLDAPPPEPAERLVVSHNDLGIEHVLVDPGTGRVTGIIDWSDAAVCDPAYDHGLLLRDLGPVAPPPAELAERAWFYARCALIEDLAYGRPEYVAKSRAQARYLFTPPGPTPSGLTSPGLTPTCFRPTDG